MKEDFKVNFLPSPKKIVAKDDFQTITAHVVVNPSKIQCEWKIIMEGEEEISSCQWTENTIPVEQSNTYYKKQETTSEDVDDVKATFTCMVNSLYYTDCDDERQYGPVNIDGICQCADTWTVTECQLESVQFTSDHALLLDNNEDWTDRGKRYGKPEWVNGRSDSYPISHTKNIKLTMKVNVIVKPKNMDFDLVGDGSKDYVKFKRSTVSTGIKQVIPVIANADLPDEVNILTESIKWGIKAKDADFNIGTSGDHIIYVTFGTPQGSLVTEKRIADVCADAFGALIPNDRKSCADSVFDSEKCVEFNLEGEIWGPENIWLLHLDDQISQCPGVALFLNKHFQMLGLGTGGIIKYCRATAEGSYVAVLTKEPVTRIISASNHPVPTTHDDECNYEALAHIDGDGAYNSFEATVIFSGYYYALPFSRETTTAKELVKKVFPGNNSILWLYYTNVIPGPSTKNICTESLWTEK